jgi:hypothetical protein
MENPNHSQHDIYFEGRLGTAKTYLHQLMYEEAFSTAINARFQDIFTNFHVYHQISPVLIGNFYSCQALALTALGKTIEGMASSILAVPTFYRSKVTMDYNTNVATELQILGNDLENSINTELIKWDSPYRCKFHLDFIAEARTDRPAAMEGRSFREWLDLPED